jgi:hypothetical protein
VVGSGGGIGVGGWAASQVASSHASSCAALGLKRESRRWPCSTTRSQ